MFCEHCGRKIDIDSNYCEHCGAKTKEEKVRKEKKGISHENKVLLIILFFLFFVFLFFMELKYFNSPKNAMQNYLKSWKNQNYTDVLTKLNVMDSPFTNEHIFSNVFHNLEEFNMTNFHVSDCTYEDNNTKAICKVYYETNKNGLSNEKTYTLLKEEKNRFAFFTNWRVLSNEIETISDWLLYLPENTKGFLAGQDLEEYRVSEQDKKGYECYKIPSIFQGIYQLKITFDNHLEIEKEIMVKKDSYTYSLQTKDISDDLKKTFQNKGIELIHLFYQGAIMNKDFISLESEMDLKEIENEYNELKNSIKEYSLTKFEVKDMKVSNLDMNEDGSVMVTYQMNFEYELQDGYQNESNDTFYICFKNMEGKEIKKIDSFITYFSKK